MQSKYEMEQEVTRLKSKKSGMSMSKISTQEKLAEIKSALRGVKKGSAEYQRLKSERATYMQILTDVERQLQGVSDEIRRLSVEKNKGAEYNLFHKSTVELLVAIRDDYQNFAADKTRVASMRQMAAEFVVRLNPVIRKAVGNT